MNFLDKEDILIIHREAIEGYGGSFGIRDEGLLESALAAPQNRFYYEDADEIACAAAYGYSFCQNHPFIDGNKRVAAKVIEDFLALNGWTLNKPSNDILEGFILAMADHLLDRDAFEARLRALAQPTE